MKVFYVIVHEFFVNVRAERGKENAISIAHKLKEIRSSKNYVELFVGENPSEIPKNLPPPEPNLEVRVCGAFTSEKIMCVDKQMYALRLSGYNASIYKPATLRSS